MDPVDLHCPTCDEVTEHDILRAAASGWTVQCTECDVARTLPAPRQPRPVSVSLILSEGSTSRTARLDVEDESTLGVDDELDFEGHRIRITAVESANGMRPRRLPSRDVRQAYAVLFDTVDLHYTVNEGETTRSLREAVAPETEIHVGTVRDVDGSLLAVKTLKSDQNRTLHRGFLLARNVRRVFAEPARVGKQPGDKVRVRSRGAGPWGSQGPSNRDRRPRGTGPRRKTP